eukprot:TRINITY_DN12531_c0_g1_i1.p1 TRINITY_DN12531_c0_g1~~TRINITY_DN12531_c0_g1_i1.p1  ORF type:complete len:934 (-),score=360.41 TRINITY_DN12531_c0_g1_i1:13-2775(-)
MSDILDETRSQETRSQESAPSSYEAAHDTTTQEKKQKEIDDSWKRHVRKKIDDERHRLERDDHSTSNLNKELYCLFNDLQVIAQKFKIDFESPELVVVGMQSDGKSSFIEALMGFQFNIVDSNIGTRRPLIIQMVNDPTMVRPYCRFRKEGTHSNELSGTHVFDESVEDSLFEKEPTPVNLLSAEIIRRTKQVAGSSNDKVSASPIILRVKFAHCASLTIIDTPGFRLGGTEELRLDIERMVKELIEPKHRIIVCLEQSTVEWANSSSRPLVRSIDPMFHRTVLVNTKFDNRVKELRTKQQAETYLRGEGLPPNKRPCFISLPLARNLDPEEYKQEMRDAYISDYSHLLNVHFDEKRFLPQLGFHRAKNFLEKLLHQKYHQSLAPTLNTLENLVLKTEQELAQIERELQENNVQDLKKRAHVFVSVFVKTVEKLLQGSVIGEPERFGQTLKQEREESGFGTWNNSVYFESSSLSAELSGPSPSEAPQSGGHSTSPGSATRKRPIQGSFHQAFEEPIEEILMKSIYKNHDLKLYGGSQFERLINEFECVAHSREFPTTSVNEVASALGLSKVHNVPLCENAASDIVQFKARKELRPLSFIALKRSSFIMKRLFKITISVIQTEDQRDTMVLGTENPQNRLGLLCQYSQFVEELCRVYESFIDKVCSNCSDKLRDDFDSLTKLIDWDLIDALSDINQYEALAPSVSREDTKRRVSRLLCRNSVPSFVDDKSSVQVLQESQPEEGNAKRQKPNPEDDSLPSSSPAIFEDDESAREDDKRSQPKKSVTFSTATKGGSSLPQSQFHDYPQKPLSTYDKVVALSTRLFAGVRYFFCKLTRHKLNAFFLDPMFQELGNEITSHFRELKDENYEKMFELGFEKLKERKTVLEEQLVQTKQARDRFREVYKKIQQDFLTAQSAQKVAKK